MYPAEGSWAPIEALMGGPPGIPGSPRPTVPGAIRVGAGSEELGDRVNGTVPPELAATEPPMLGKGGCGPAC